MIDDRQDELWVCRLGTVDYLHALALQEQVRAARQAGVVPDTMLLLEHPRVYTRGRRSDEQVELMRKLWSKLSPRQSKRR